MPKKDHQAAKDTIAYEAIKRIGAIYHLDNQLADLKPDDRKKQRQINLKPLVEAFFVWAKEIQFSGRLTKGKTLEGINYCINQEEALKVFLDDGEVPLDNNATEGALRSFCLHKHAWKLIDSIDGAQSIQCDHLQYHGNSKGESSKSLPLSGIYPDRDEGSSGGYGLSFYGRTASMV